MGPGLGGELLAEEFQGCDGALFTPGNLLHGEFAFHENAAGTADGVVDFHAGLGLEHLRHDGADFGRSVELAGALAAALGELADEVFVALANDVGFNVVEPEALSADGLDEVGEGSSSKSRCPWVVALKSTRSMIPCRSGFSLAMARMLVVTPSPILLESLGMTDQTGCSGSSGTRGR